MHFPSWLWIASQIAMMELHFLLIESQWFRVWNYGTCEFFLAQWWDGSMISKYDVRRQIWMCVKIWWPKSMFDVVFKIWCKKINFLSNFLMLQMRPPNIVHMFGHHVSLRFEISKAFYFLELRQNLIKFLWVKSPNYTVDGQKVPDVQRRLICQKVWVSRNLSQKVMPSDI